jgi:hypothetical protein
MILANYWPPGWGDVLLPPRYELLLVGYPHVWAMAQWLPEPITMALTTSLLLDLELSHLRDRFYLVTNQDHGYLPVVEPPRHGRSVTRATGVS